MKRGPTFALEICEARIAFEEVGSVSDLATVELTVELDQFRSAKHRHDLLLSPGRFAVRFVVIRVDFDRQFRIRVLELDRSQLLQSWHRISADNFIVDTCK